MSDPVTIVRKKMKVSNSESSKKKGDTVKKLNSVDNSKVTKIKDASESPPSAPSTLDPILRDSIYKRLVLRNTCSLKIGNLPKIYNYATIMEIAPDMTACRLQYIKVSRKPAKIAFIEFPSKELVMKNQTRLNGMTYSGKKLSATLGGDLSEIVGKNIEIIISSSRRLLHTPCQT